MENLTASDTGTQSPDDDLLTLFVYASVLADPELAAEVTANCQAAPFDSGPYRSRRRKDSARPRTVPRVNARPRARRSPRRGTVKTTQDPGSDDDGDPDPDPVGAAVARLVADAPSLSPGQRALLGRILGGVR